MRPPSNSLASFSGSSTALEDDLRARLEGVELVCEADIPDGLLDAAEQVARQRLDRGDFTALGHSLAATWVSYAAMRGAERYEGQRLWPHLGVQVGRQRAGQAMLDALRRLGLPDFQHIVSEERARRYVTPILIHGGIPAASAQRLVRRVEMHLERGLVDGAEAVQQMTDDRDLVADLGRPVARLIRYVPDYAAALIDRLIDYLDGADDGNALPRHLVRALAADGPKRGRRRRLTPPVVELDTWSGFGPEAVLGAGSERWVIELDGAQIALAAEQRAALRPADRAVATGAGRHQVLWDHPVMWFDVTGRLVPSGDPLPMLATALVPPGWDIEGGSGDRPEIVDEGAPLSGEWSGYHCWTVQLRPGDRIRVVADGDSRAAPRSWSVHVDLEPSLAGAPLPGVATDDGAPVFARLPQITVPRSSDPVPVWFSPASGGRSSYDRLPATNGTIDLRSIVPDEPVVGRVEVRGRQGLRQGLSFAYIPGLDVQLPAEPVGPAARPVVSWTMTGVETRVEAALPEDEELALPIPGLPEGSIVALLPRVRWGLRRGAPGRLELAQDTIYLDEGALAEPDLFLVVRSGVEASLRVELSIDGITVQERSASFRTGGRRAQAVIPLAPFHDTLRRAGERTAQLRLVIGDTPLVAVQAGRKPPGDERVRHWQPDVTDHGPDWGSLPWLTPGYSVASEARETLEDARGVLRRLRLLDGPDQVAEFVRLLGQASRSWSQRERDGAPPHGDGAWGPGGKEWRSLSVAADQLWQLEGVRYRQWSGGRLEERLASWFRTTAERARNADPTRRSKIELWTFGRSPNLDEQRNWWHFDWLAATWPDGRRRQSGVDRFPGTLLFQLLSLAGGVDEPGPALAEAVALEPTAALELVTFLLEATRQGHALHPPSEPTLDDDDADDDEEEQVAAEEEVAPANVVRPPSTGAAIRPSDLQVNGRLITAPRRDGQEAPVVRIWCLRDGKPHRALALLPMYSSSEGWHVALPIDIDGEIGLSLADRSARRPGTVPTFSVDPAQSTRPSAPHVRTHALAALDDAIIDVKVARIQQAVDEGLPAAHLIEALYEEEEKATSALCRWATRHEDPAGLERLTCAVLPAALLFSTPPIEPHDAEALRRASPHLWAAIAARRPTEWRWLGWPNPHRFDAGSTQFDDVIAFSRKVISSERVSCSHRYDLTGPGERRLATTLRRIDHQLGEGTFADLVSTAYAAAMSDEAAVEATRLLLRSHAEAPTLTMSAVLVGIALTLAMSGGGQ